VCTPSKHAFLGPPESIGSSVFAGLRVHDCDRQTDRQTETDRPRYSVCNNRLDELMLRCGLIIPIPMTMFVVQ